jgi:hypothetical protein
LLAEGAAINRKMSKDHRYQEGQSPSIYNSWLRKEKATSVDGMHHRLGMASFGRPKQQRQRISREPRADSMLNR